jgi:ABC-type nitrate/sulfonate/bicarbonate transport system substrate-binding protein
MQKISTVIFTLFIFLIAGRPASAQLKKLHFSTTSIAVTELQFRIAQMKGFYREEGLDLETILIRGSVGMQALIGGSVDYASAAGSIIAAGVRGAGKAGSDRQLKTSVRPRRPTRYQVGSTA